VVLVEVELDAGVAGDGPVQGHGVEGQDLAIDPDPHGVVAADLDLDQGGAVLVDVAVAVAVQVGEEGERRVVAVGQVRGQGGGAHVEHVDRAAAGDVADVDLGAAAAAAADGLGPGGVGGLLGAGEEGEGEEEGGAVHGGSVRGG
jgi:hypothetical protein